MEIQKQNHGERMVIRLRGRLDGRSADHLDSELAEAIRAGSRHIHLEMVDVDYLSSPGIRVLVKAFKELQRIDGTLRLASASEAVRGVLSLSGLDALLQGTEAPPTKPLPSPEKQEGGEREFGPVRMRIFSLPEANEPAPGTTARAKTAEAGFSCRFVGQPPFQSANNLLPTPKDDLGRDVQATRNLARDTQATKSFPVRIGPRTLALGIGAFGRDFEDCRGRFGEFLAAGNAAASMPTDGSGAPDWQVARGEFLPEAQALHAAVCEGCFSHFIQFEPKEITAPVALSQLLGAALQAAEMRAAAVVILAESAGLVGAQLKHSPALPFSPIAAYSPSTPSAAVRADESAAPGDPFDFQNIRRWLSFTSERAHARTLALIAGLVTLDPSPGSGWEDFVRPLGGSPPLFGHFHAAAFSYRALARGPISLPETVGMLFEGEALQGLLHLLSDDRPLSGAGETELHNGSLWMGPIQIPNPGNGE